MGHRNFFSFEEAASFCRDLSKHMELSCTQRRDGDREWVVEFDGEFDDEDLRLLRMGLTSGYISSMKNMEESEAAEEQMKADIQNWKKDLE